MESQRLSSAIESILLAADRPIGVERLNEVFGDDSPGESEIKSLLEEIRNKYATETSGIELREAIGGYQLCTRKENAEWVRRYFQTKPFRLGRSTLETLAIIAYRQPITRAEIDQVRGIDSSHLLRTLMERGIVKMAGKADVPGRPVQYATTQKFLEVVGLNTLGDLPPLSELEKLEGHTEDIQLPSIEDGLDRIIAETDGEVSVSSSQDKTMLAEIEGLIEAAQDSRKEIFESPEHAEIAAANEEANKGFMAFSRQQKRAARANLANLVDTPEVLQAGTEIGEGETGEEGQRKKPSIREMLEADILPGPPNPGSETPDPIIN